VNATLRNIADLTRARLVSPERAAELEAVAARYAVAITPPMAELSRTCEAVARQFVPDAAELDQRPGERADPIGDEAHSPVEGIIHRYPDRVLLKANHACAVYCRFCFRREMVGPQGLRPLSPDVLDTAFAYVAARPAIWELIVTGGDPFILSPRRIADLMARASAIPHVKVVRFHTRVPVVQPETITDDLVAAMTGVRPTVWVALHANHPAEFTEEARAACAKLVDAGIPMVSQSVLLKGVNDDAATLTALMRAFVENRIKPYYLHHGDLAPGTSHLRTDIDEGQALMREIRGGLSGLAQPTFVLDIPGGHGKVPIGPGYLSDGVVEDPQGRRHRYPPPID
jgi:lysine 2,3-aminomutase